MIKHVSDFIIWSDDYKSLAKWYRDVLELKKVGEVDHPRDKAIGFSIGNDSGNNVELWIGYHDKVEGKNKDKYRIMVNYAVESVSGTYNQLMKKGVKFLIQPFKAPTFEKYFATFEDPDGNILQLIGGK